MRFERKLAVDSAFAAPDPIAEPESVPVGLRAYSKTERSSRMVGRWLFALDGATGDTLAVELYTLASEVGITPGTSALEDAPPPADDVWVRFGAAPLALPTGELTEVLAGPAGGTIYVRTTGGTSGPRSLYVRCVD